MNKDYKIYPIVRKNAPRMSKSDIDTILRALKAKVNAAKANIIACRPKLIEEFEINLNVTYPPSGDPVWMDALNRVVKEYEIQRARVEARCRELNIPAKFRPALLRPGWSSSWKSSCSDFEDLRVEMRRLANIQADNIIKSMLAQLETDSANIQYELAIHGCVTDAARQFLANLPTVESLIPKLRLSEVEALIEGRAMGIPPAMLSNGSGAEDPALTMTEKPQLPSSDGNKS